MRRRLTRWPGSSLRARLTLAFAAIILFTLALASASFALVIRDDQWRREMARISELTIPLTGQLRSLELLGSSREEIADFLERQADDLDLRLVLADSRGQIFSDTEDDELVGRTLEIQGTTRASLGRRVRQASVNGPEGELAFVVAPTGGFGREAAPPPPPAPSGQTGAGSQGRRPFAREGSFEERFQRQSAYLLGLSVPRQSLAEAWLELLPRLSVAAAGALVLSTVIAWPLASSIARPLSGMTHAAEQIARGDLDQRLPPVWGNDEVARLARAFDRMAQEVGRSQRALRSLLANVSHDLRTPLTSIQGFSQALTDGTLADQREVAEAGQVINQEAARMSRLVDDLLYLSRVEAGQLPLQWQELDLATLLERRLAAVARRAEEAGVVPRLETPARPLVRADQSSLERVVDNLVENALRHTPAGQQVIVRLTQPEPGWAELQVRNGGEPIPAEDLPRIFERFYQVDRARAEGGTGLGLAIIREIVQAHGGSCAVSSSQAEGTTFMVRLPALETPIGEPEPTRTGSPAPRAAGVLPVRPVR
jgi:signal transduction histidine kinase